MTGEGTDPDRTTPQGRGSAVSGNFFTGFAIWATVMLAVLIAGSHAATFLGKYHRLMFVHFTYGAPFWLIGHLLIYIGGRKIIAGNRKAGMWDVRASCIGVAVLMLIGCPVFYFSVFLGHEHPGDIVLYVFVFGPVAYLFCLLFIFMLTFDLSQRNA